jgi:signal transduction histidine kinase
VADTGIGIRAEDLSKLFQPFRQLDSGLQRQHEGTGLGLAICGRLTTMLGGTIQVTSVHGQGSTFTVLLPLEPQGVP